MKIGAFFTFRRADQKLATMSGLKFVEKDSVKKMERYNDRLVLLNIARLAPQFQVAVLHWKAFNEDMTLIQQRATQQQIHRKMEMLLKFIRSGSERVTVNHCSALVMCWSLVPGGSGLSFCEAKTSCWHCLITEKELERCARCKLAHYCSPECQKDDWNKHKKICVSFETASKGNPVVRAWLA